MTSRRLIARSFLLAWVGDSLIFTLRSEAGEPGKAGRYPFVTAEQLKKLIDSSATQDIVVVDTQPSEYFQEAHLPGAVNLPYADRIRTPVNLPRTKTLVLYCPCEQEEESIAMATKLEKLGYTRLKILQGGLPRWRELGYPTVGSTNGQAEKR